MFEKWEEDELGGNWEEEDDVGLFSYIYSPCCSTLTATSLAESAIVLRTSAKIFWWAAASLEVVMEVDDNFCCFIDSFCLS